MHYTRLLRKHTILAATALSAALILTACESGDDTNGGGKPDASVSASTPGSDPSGTEGGDNGGSTGGDSEAGADQGGAGESSTDEGSTGSGEEDAPGTLAGGDGSSEEEPPGTLAGGDGATEGDPCSGDNVSATVTKIDRPVNHMLIKITNNSSERCDAFGAPALRIDEGQAAVRVLEESQPQSVVGVEPGESAYAAIGLFSADGSGELTDASKLEIHFQGKEMNGSVGTAINKSLPAGTKVDENVFVTYWQSDLQDAVTY